MGNNNLFDGVADKAFDGLFALAFENVCREKQILSFLKNPIFMEKFETAFLYHATVTYHNSASQKLLSQKEIIRLEYLKNKIYNILQERYILQHGRVSKYSVMKKYIEENIQDQTRNIAFQEIDGKDLGRYLELLMR